MTHRADLSKETPRHQSPRWQGGEKSWHAVFPLPTFREETGSGVGPGGRRRRTCEVQWPHLWFNSAILGSEEGCPAVASEKLVPDNWPSKQEAGKAKELERERK